MKTKTLYIVITNSGDGSNALQYTFSKDDINKLEEKLDGEGFDETYASGDGLQVEELNVPEEFTYETLGISKYSILELQDEDIDE